MERLTVDNPRNNRETLLNYAYAKDGRVYLSYADCEGGVDLCEYIAKNACCEEVDAAAVMDGACMECNSKTAILYTVAVQAAELRARLAYYEDMEEQGRLVVLPCKVGDTVYRVFAPEGREPVISSHTLMSVDYIVRWIDKFGKTVFLTREEAEQALKGGAN